MMKHFFLSLSFATIIPLSTYSQTIDGDMNHDGVLNIEDISILVDKVLGKHTTDYIDLALPSRTLWATCNIGASKPEEHGDYFAWSENVASVEWGEDWAMPTHEQIQELLNEELNYVETARCGDVDGFVVESKENGNWIFLPVAGYKENGQVLQNGKLGFYWCGETNPDRPANAWIMTFNYPYNMFSAVSDSSKNYEYCVRPVKKKEQKK